MKPLETRRSADGSAIKTVLELSDGRVIETVLLRPSSRRWTACVSSQAGCGFACTFCATGLMGAGRNLRAEEIVGQIVYWRRFMKQESLGAGPGNVVYMGMGEPFANYEEVAASLKSLLAPKPFGFGPSRISVSTVGIAPMMERFSAEFPGVNLALSLHSTDNGVRGRIVPANKAYPLERLRESLTRHIQANERKIMLEYVLLAGENDGPEDARSLIEYVKSISAELLHVNLMIFNPTDTRHAASSEETARKFQKQLRDGGIKATVRLNLGRDIFGACGQLSVARALP